MIIFTVIHSLRCVTHGKNYSSLNLIVQDPVVCIPCTYFLDGAGTPLEVIAVPLSADQFLDKINQTIQVFHLAVNYPRMLDIRTLSATCV